MMSKITKSESVLWVLKSVADSEKSYQTVESYNDKIDTAYNYDSKVANFKRIKVGDYVILISKTHILGFAKLEAVRQEAGTKVISRCIECISTTIEYRKTKSPKYRCNRGHVFEKPRQEAVAITKYFAEYKNTFITAKELETNNIQILRPYYRSGYNRNMSMQLLDINALKLFPTVFEKLYDDHLSAGILSPNHADDDTEDPSSEEQISVVSLPPLDEVDIMLSGTPLINISLPKTKNKVSDVSFTYGSKNAKKYGDRGEFLVLKYLRNILSKSEAETLRHHAAEKEKDGYDISYIDTNGQKIYIEVKATSANSFPNFVLTINELMAAEAYGNFYKLFLVNKVTSTNASIEVIDNIALLLKEESFSKTPMSFKIQRNF